MIKLNEIEKVFKDNERGYRILNCINLRIAANEIIALLGPNGCGKTTLLKIIAGLEKPTSGSIEWKMAPKIGFIFQDANNSLFPWQTVDKHIHFALEHGNSTQDINMRKQAILYKLNLFEHRHKYPYQLSGGMKQLVALGRGLALSPNLFILDEPFSALDYHTTVKMQEKFLEMVAEMQVSSIVATHSLEEAIFLADRIIILSTRPAAVVKEINVNIERPRVFSHRGSSRYLQVKNEILSELRGFII